MAIFASTTTSGYSDPIKAQSIKALEQRQRDLQAQMAAQQPDAAMMGTIPGGIGHVLNKIGGRMEQGRADEALASQRDVLAKAMTGYDVTGDAPPPSVIATAAPEIYKDMMQTWSENRRQREKVRTDEIATGQQNTFTAAQAAQKALDAQVAADAEEKRLQARPASEGGKIMHDVRGGKLPPEQGEAMVSKLSAPSATEMQAGNALQTTHLDTQSVISDLKEARDLLGPEGTGIRAGTGAGLTQTGAKWAGDTLGLSDPKLTQRTERFNQIMSAEAINAMAQRLKGASTEYEMKAFVALMNDPNAEPKTKVDALNKMIAKAEAHATLQLDQMKRAKVPAPAGVGGGASTAAPQSASQDAQALEWANANPNDPRAAAIKQRLGK